ncbi:TonB-dependent receptor [Pontibacter diazotrophicus]|uniref:TonB-dependent receptor n=1 Tax=Pontibacter diazotrophicus TaxID=1400979 RepID=A0A3D8LE62_9BACT|nr:TonB-dependent receptor [Pontibacter diazotrophicus]RDV15643.1 TonB-dependent receptor [Pontibacter diazotrophicus]
MKKHVLLSMLLMFAIVVQSWGQLNRSIRGQVTSEGGDPLPGVSVIVKGTTVGASTDVEGRFSINNIPADANTLVFRYLGFADQEVRIGERNIIDVTLTASSRSIEEVVVVGYGTQTREELTGSIASVTAEALEDIPVVSVDQALQGRAAGVQVTQNSGTPGSGIAVRVRGAASIGAGNEPLYVVDGVPINTGNYSAIGTGGQQTNALADLNPNDIASMEILKDAASAAIYGSRASNGVVLITTKRGANAKTKINFGYYTGVQETWNRLNTLTGPQQVELYNEMVFNRYGDATGLGFASQADLTAYFFNGFRRARNDAGLWAAVDRPDGLRAVSTFEDPSTAPNTDWQDQIFRTAPISNYDLSISGGNERTKFLVSGTYFDQQGIVIGSAFERANGRLNLDHSISDKIRVGTSLGISRSVNSRIQNDNNINGVVSTALLVASDIPVYREDGTYAKDPGASTENPVAAAVEPTLSAISARVIGNTFAEWDILPSLRFRTTFGIDYLTFREEDFRPTTTNTGAGSNGLGQMSYRQDVSWLNENTLNYNKVFNEIHDFSALVGISYQQSTFNSIFAAATGFPGNDIQQLSAGSIKTDASSSESAWGLESYFSRFNYSLMNRYLFSASVRADGSSRFGANNRYGVFPAASVGWRISEEAFMENLDFLSELKLRASYGITGNSEIGNFDALALVGAGANYLQQAGLAPTQLGNPNLTWEETKQTNIGLDFGVLNNRIVLNVDAYLKLTDNLLLARPLVGSSGFTSVQENIGSMENKGLEFALTSYNIESNEPNGFNWNTNFNIAFNRNEITKLYGGNPYGVGFASWVEEGQPLGAFRGYVVDGIFQTQDEITALNDAAAASTGNAGAVYQSAATSPGDIRFRDLDGDGRITGDDQQIIGSAQPRYTGGLTNNLSYAGFDLSFFFQFTQGNQIYNNTRAFSEGMNGVFGQTAGVLNRWTPENTDTDVPRAVYGDPNNNRRTSDRWLEDGSYIRLKNIVLGYNLPTSLTERVHLQRARLFVQSQNLFTITDYSGFDPEVNTFSGSNAALGTDFLVYPQARTITFGVNIGL